MLAVGLFKVGVSGFEAAATCNYATICAEAVFISLLV